MLKDLTPSATHKAPRHEQHQAQSDTKPHLVARTEPSTQRAQRTRSIAEEKPELSLPLRISAPSAPSALKSLSYEPTAPPLLCVTHRRYAGLSMLKRTHSPQTGNSNVNRLELVGGSETKIWR